MARSGPEVASDIRQAATATGLVVRGDDAHIEGEVESIRAKWFLGKRTVQYRMSCGIDEPTRTVLFHESMVERTTGMAPPTFSVETTSQKGTRVDIDRKDVSTGGRGTVSYGRLRAEIERVVTAAGWKFDLKLI